MNIRDWRAFTSIFDMQINPWRPFWIYANQLIFEINQITPLKGIQKDIDEYWRLESVYIDLGYAN